MEQRKIIAAVLVLLGTGVMTRADLAPVWEPDAREDPGSGVLPPYPPLRADSSRPWARLVVADVDSRACGLVPEGSARIEPDAETERVFVLADRQNCVDLCLCALLGLGLCRAVPCVKKLSWGAIPEWYHDGGPYQIGHRLALAPDCRGPAVVCRLCPPDDRSDDLACEYRCGILPLLWRQSQFLPSLLAARGPPSS